MAAFWISTLVTGLVLCVVGIFCCDDLDSTACARLASLRPDMCNDTCFVSVCKRYCGQCPFKCYSCDGIANPQNCNLTEECPSKDYKCISVHTYSDDFLPVYKLGCAPSAVCSGTNCCSTDFCNNHASKKRSTNNNNPKTQDMTVLSRRQTPSAACADVDNLACTLLFTSNINVCQNDCVANVLCPELCGKCSKCYDCDHVLTTERCNHSRTCKAGEVCYTLETLNFDLEHGYRMGCVHQQVCDSMSSQVSNVFGRRSDSVEVSMSGGCCHGDLCNHHKLTSGVMSTNSPLTTMPTTTAKACSMTAGCPFNLAARLDGQCYFIGNSPLSWSNAKAFCKSHCSHLAIFQDLNQLRLIMEVLHLSDAISHLPAVQHHDIPDMYVDAVNPTHSNFVWSTTNQTVSYTLFSSSTQSHRYSCAFVHSTRQLEGTSCSQMYYPLCQSRLQ